MTEYNPIMYDQDEVTEFTLGATIPLALPFANIRIEVKAKNPEDARLALIEMATITLPVTDDQDREKVNNYLKRVLAPAKWEYKKVKR